MDDNMISHVHAWDRKIRDSNIEEILDRLQQVTTDQNCVEILAELGREIANNPIFEPYIKYIAEKEETYRKIPAVASIIQQASYEAQGEQQLQQEMLIRTERIEEFFSVWLIIRSYEQYDIACHARIRSELKESGNLRDLADFEEGVTAFSSILKGETDWKLRDFYLPHAHRAVLGIIQFFDKQPLTEQALENGVTQFLDSYPQNRSKEKNKKFKLEQAKQPVTVKQLLEERQVSLSRNSEDEKDDIRLSLFKKKKPSEHTNQIRVYFEIIKGPISKYKLMKNLGLSSKEVERAYRTLNTIVKHN
jgi:hypothetical protein